MGFLTNILITVATVLTTAFGIYNYMPLDWLGMPSKDKLGVTITNIAGTDTIKDSRATINTNFSNLNTGKIEVGTTSVASITTLGGLTTASSLATVGTITSGTWNGSVIDVARQGTGTTSPSLYQVLLGNGANGITVASSTGTTGQFLTSNGGGAYPSWQTSAVDQGINYTWTGNHTFNGATTTLKTTSGTTTVIIDTRTSNTDSALNFTENGSNSVGVGLQLDGSDNALYVRDLGDNAILGVFSRTDDRFGVGTTTPGATISAAGDIYSTTGFRMPNGITFDGTYVTNATTSAPGFTGNMIISHALGRTPVFVRITANSSCSGTTDTAVEVMCSSLGTATSTTSTNFVTQSVGCVSDNCVNAVAVNSSFGVGKIISLNNAAGTVRVAANLTALSSTSFTINFSTNTSNTGDEARNIIWELY